MKGIIRRLRPSPAMVVACIALVFAMTGAGYAAGMLGPNTVGTKQLKKNAVISSKVKNRSLLAVDFKAGQLPRGAQGLQGPQGPQGVQGAQGPAGPDNARIIGGTGIGFVDTPINSLFPNFQNAGTVTFNAPSAGFAQVTGVATLYRRGAGGACVPDCRVAARLRDVTSGTASPHTLAVVDDSASIGSASITPQWVFQIPAGSRTFVLEVASADGNAAGRTGVFNTALNVVFTPGGSAMSIGGMLSGTSSTSSP